MIEAKMLMCVKRWHNQSSMVAEEMSAQKRSKKIKEAQKIRYV